MIWHIYDSLNQTEQELLVSIFPLSCAEADETSQEGDDACRPYGVQR